MHTWQLQEAKSKFSQLVEQAINFGPQMVTKHGVEAVVVLSQAEYNRLSTPKKNIFNTLLSAPKCNLDLTRSEEIVREIEL